MVVKMMMVLLLRTILLSQLYEKGKSFIQLTTCFPKVTQKLTS